jgi:hypothetical protein
VKEDDEGDHYLMSSSHLVDHHSTDLHPSVHQPQKPKKSQSTFHDSPFHFGAPKMSFIYIPIYRSDEHVALPLEQLSATDPKDLIRLMVKERVPLEIWLKVAVRPHLSTLQILTKPLKYHSTIQWSSFSPILIY